MNFESLKLSQNFVKCEIFHNRGHWRKFRLDHFLNIFQSHIKVSFESQNGILESYLVVLNEF